MLSTGITSTTKRVWIPASQMYATSDKSPATREMFVTSNEAQEYDVWTFPTGLTRAVGFVTETLGRYVYFDVLWTTTASTTNSALWSLGGNSVNVGHTTDVASTNFEPEVLSAHSGTTEYLNACRFGAVRLTGGISPSPPALGPVSVWSLLRLGSEAADTLTSDAHVIGAFAYFYG